ncbi:MAGa3780 family membrane protein [Mesomycoplasma neurolyticum]|nr:hypothetical protein [Mesomycoplasma neurolyticum]
MTTKFFNLEQKQNKKFLIFGIFVFITTLLGIIKNIVMYQPFIIESQTLDIDILFGRASSIFYFTYQTNFLLSIALIVVALRPNSMSARQFLFGSTSLITITFLVYWTLIGPFNSWNNFWHSIVSITTHLINPLIGFYALYLIKNKLIVNKRVILIASFYFFSYFIFQALIYSSTFKEWNYIAPDGKEIKFYDGISIYEFSNYSKPFLYKEKYMPLVIVLDLILFVLAIVFPLLISLFWKKVYKIKIQKKKFALLNKK